MALPPIDEGEELEGSEPPLEDDLEPDAEVAPDVDPMFAADIAEAFPDLEDAQIAAIQRAVLGLIGSMGGPPPMDPSGSAPLL